MKEWEIQQKNERIVDNIIYYFSHILSWFLNFVAKFAMAFVKAMIEAIKLIFHTK